MTDTPSPRHTPATVPGLVHKRDQGQEPPKPAVVANPAIAMTDEQMSSVIRDARPGDKLRIVFADKPVESYRIEMILVLCLPVPGRTPTLSLAEVSALNLMVIAEVGRWARFRTYEVSVLEGFDPEDFIYRTLRHGLLESITSL